MPSIFGSSAKLRPVLLLQWESDHDGKPKLRHCFNSAAARSTCASYSGLVNQTARFELETRPRLSLVVYCVRRQNGS